MKRILRLLDIPFVAGLLFVATAVPAFADHTGTLPPVSGEAHNISCANQLRAVQKASDVAGAPQPIIDGQIKFYENHCGPIPIPDPE